MASIEDNRLTGDEWLCDGHLPAEILANIGQHLSFSDRLKLRAVFPKKRKRFVEDMLKDELGILYVSPTHQSLANFANICASEFYRSHITEVVFVPRGFGGNAGDGESWHFDQFDFSDMCELHELAVANLGHDEEMRVFQKYKALCAKHMLRVNPIEWGYYRRPFSKGETEEVIDLLATGLKSLPGFKDVAVAARVSRSGLNANSFWYSEKYKQEVVRSGGYTVQGTPDWDRTWDVLYRHWSFDIEGLEEFFRALKKANTMIDTFALGPGVQEELREYMIERIDRGPIEDVLFAVPKVSFSFCNYIGTDGGLEGFWKILADSMKSVRELTFFMNVHDPEPRSPHDGSCEQALHKFLFHGTFPHLQELRIEGPMEEPVSVEAALLRLVLERHLDLHSVVLHNVLIDNGWYNDVTTLESIRSVLDCASNIDNRGLFQMKLARLPKYPPPGGLRLKTTDLDDLANELNVELVNGSWDFGEVVRRRRVTTATTAAPSRATVRGWWLWNTLRGWLKL